MYLIAILLGEIMNENNYSIHTIPDIPLKMEGTIELNVEFSFTIDNVLQRVR